jgi:hypothetical protein
MAMAFVYVLENPSMPGVVKIGFTKGLTREWAKQLHTTGVPTPFQVVHDELVGNCELMRVLEFVAELKPCLILVHVANKAY